MDDELDWLGRRGGWVLLALGVVLIGLSVVVVEHEAVAAIFAFTGVATAILGVLLPRLEGPLELSITKLVANFKAARKAAAREDLTFDERANEVFKLLGIRGDAPMAGHPEEKPDESRVAGSETRRIESLPRPIEFVVTGRADRAHDVAYAFERHVAESFRRAGWKVEQSGPGADFGIDFVARRGDDTTYVEVKLRRRLSVADVNSLIDIFRRLDPQGHARYVLALNEGALSSPSRQALADAGELEVLEFPVEGW